MLPTAVDPIECLPDPATLRVMLAESVRRSELLRSLLRVANRKASYHPADQMDILLPVVHQADALIGTAAR